MHAWLWKLSFGFLRWPIRERYVIGFIEYLLIDCVGDLIDV